MHRFPQFTAFSPRPVRYLGLTECGGHRIKKYSITFDELPLAIDDFESAFASMAAPQLPHPSIQEGRPGLGFVIFHQGRSGNYVVLCWWDRENEMPTRIFVRDNAGWRPANNNEGVCVWDLEVIYFERCLYIDKVLCRNREPSLDAYCEANFGLLNSTVED